MRLELNFRLTDAFCLIANEVSDEPFLWTFFLKLDGDTVRQTFPNSTGFQSSIQVFTAGGSHGNLNATGVKTTRRIPIPPHIGGHLTTLRPIGITFAGHNFFVPGQFLAVAVLLEEDASPDDGIENGHQSLRSYIEERVNLFIGSLSLTEIFAEANGRVTASGGVLADHAANIVNERFDALIQEIRDDAETVIELDILAAHTPGAFWEFLDADDLINAHTFRFNERAVLNDILGMSQFLVQDISHTDDGHVESMYRLVAQMNANVQFVPGDIRQTSAPISSAPAETGRHTLAHSGVCISAGQVVEWTRHDQVEEEAFLFLYPFLPVTWSVEGKEMAGPAGEVRFMHDCMLPFFDPEQPAKPRYRPEKREVAISFTRFNEGPLPGIRIRNRPQDGSYHAKMEASAVVGGLNKVVIATLDFAFDGQAITSPFFEAFSECLERVFGYKRYKEVGLRELWGPFERQRWFEQQVRLGEQLARAGILKPSVVQAGIRVMQQKLRIR